MLLERLRCIGLSYAFSNVECIGAVPTDEESNLGEENIGEENNLKSEVKILKKGLSLVPLLLMLAIIGLLTEWILYLKGN